MQDFGAAFGQAFALIVGFDPALMEIIGLSMRVTFTAVLIACVIGLPLGAGLAVYLMLSAAGPLGVLQLLYTPTAMIIAQSILVTPIIAALTRQVIEDMHSEYDELLRSMGASRLSKVVTLLWDARYSLLTAALAGLGRALAEVGAVMIVGGNINHVTRVMTTAIALETSKGALALALGLGIILVGLSILVNAGLMGLRKSAERLAYA